MSTFSTPGIVALILAAIVVVYFGLCGVGHLAEPGPNDDPRDGSV